MHRQVRLRRKTFDYLKSQGEFGETMDDIIRRLIGLEPLNKKKNKESGENNETIDVGADRKLTFAE